MHPGAEDRKDDCSERKQEKAAHLAAAFGSFSVLAGVGRRWGGRGQVSEFPSGLKPDYGCVAVGGTEVAPFSKRPLKNLTWLLGGLHVVEKAETQLKLGAVKLPGQRLEFAFAADGVPGGLVQRAVAGAGLEDHVAD